MADTIIAPAARDTSGDSVAGWAVAVLLLLGVILFGIFIWPGIPSRVAPSTPTDTSPTIDVNLSVPEGAIPGTNSGNTNTNQGSGNTAPQPTQ